MSRLERLVNLTAALIDAGRPLTRDELRQRVGGYSDDPAAFRRTFERDKDLLRQMGMPVTTEVVHPERPDSLGYRIRRDDYELPDPGLDDAELAALRLATSAVSVGGADGASATALRKLAAAPTPTSAALTPTAADLAVDERAATVFGAVADRRRLRFGYHGRDRLVDPWRMSYRNGQWYLAGFDHHRGESRLYRLDRVTGTVDAVGEPASFERPANAATGPARPWQIGDDEPVTAELIVDASQAHWATEALGPGSVVSRGEDGSVRFAVEVTSRAAWRTFVLGLLDHAEVLGPPALRDDITDWLGALARSPAPATTRPVEVAR